MCLVEEEDQCRVVRVSHLRQIVVERAQEPDEQAAVEPGRLHQLLRLQDIDRPSSTLGGKQILGVKVRHPEYPVPTLTLQSEEGALDSTDGGGGDIAVGGRDLLAVLRQVAQHRLQILEVIEKETILIRYPEGYLQETALHVIQLQDPLEEHRSYAGDGHTHRGPLLTEGIPEADRIALLLISLAPQTILVHTLGDGGLITTRLTHPGQVSLGIHQEDGAAEVAKGLRQGLTGNGLTGTCSTGNQPMAIHLLRQEAHQSLSCPPHIGDTFSCQHGNSDE